MKLSRPTGWVEQRAGNKTSLDEVVKTSWESPRVAFASFVALLLLGTLVPVLRVPLAYLMAGGFLIAALARFDLALGLAFLAFPFFNLLPTSILGIPGLNPETVLFTVLVAAYLAVWRPRSSLRGARSHTGILLALFFLIVGFSVIQAWYVFDRPLDVGFGRAKRWLIYASLFYLVRGTVRNNQQARWLFHIFLASFLLIGVIGIRGYIAGLGGTGRVAGIISNQPNEFGGILAVNLMFMIAFLFRAKSIGSTVLGGVALGTCLFSLLFTLSRGSILGFLVGLAFMGAVLSRRVLVLALACAIVVFFLPGRVQQRFEETFTSSTSPGPSRLPEDATTWDRMKQLAEFELDVGTDDSTAMRLVLWRSFPRMLAVRPILGNGLNTYPDVLVMTKSWYWPKAPHSSWLRIGIEQGILGLVVVALLLGSFFTRAWRVQRDPPSGFAHCLAVGCIASLVVVLVVNLAGARFHHGVGMAYFWAFNGMLHGLSRESFRAFDELDQRGRSA